MKVVVDRVEGDVVVVEIAGIPVDLPRSALPDAVEGAAYTLTFHRAPAPRSGAETLERLRARALPTDDIDL